MNVEILHGDNIFELDLMPDNSVDAIVTDPPYGLSFMGKKWDYDVPGVELWQQCLRVLKPGGHLLCFGGSRTYHRVVLNIEDAGFEIRDQLMWVYGSGFPKSLDISKAIDKAAGAEREVIGSKRRDAGSKSTHAFESSRSLEYDVTVPATAAAAWNGWGTALKPAHEPICLARKPISGTVADNVLEYGTGGLNIDGCRVAFTDAADKASATPNGKVIRKNFGPGKGLTGTETIRPDNSAGRWPANLIHDGSDEVIQCFPDAPGQLAGESEGAEKTSTVFGKYKENKTGKPRKDAGSAARFFYCAKASKKDREEGLEYLSDKLFGHSEGAKKAIEEGAGETNDRTQGMNQIKKVKNHHPTVKPTALMQYLVRLITPPGGVILDPYAGSGSTGKAAILEGFDVILMEREAEYIPIIEGRTQWALNESLKDLL